MGRNLTPIILIILAIGTFFTFTRGRIDGLKEITEKNKEYQAAIKNAEQLIKVRDEVLKNYNNISAEDRERLDKMVPNNVDNVRLIIDVNDVANRHGFSLRNVKTSATPSGTTGSTNTSSSGSGSTPQVSSRYDTVTLSFNVTAPYQNFLAFLEDIERSLRIMDISKITLSAGEGGIYEYGVEIKTYWLKQ
jgi:Tfp pilus assembly protein PilO